MCFIFLSLKANSPKLEVKEKVGALASWTEYRGGQDPRKRIVSKGRRKK
jgi:hypothetical protein